jgi:hypothetical protein
MKRHSHTTMPVLYSKGKIDNVLCRSVFPVCKLDWESRTIRCLRVVERKVVPASLSRLRSSVAHFSNSCFSPRTYGSMCSSRRALSVASLLDCISCSHPPHQHQRTIVRATPPVQCTANFGWRKVKTCQFGSAKWFWPSIFAQDAKVGKRHSRA